MLRFVLLALVGLTACHPFVSAARDTNQTVNRTSIAVGGGDRDFTVGLGVHVEEAPDAYAGSTTLDFGWSVLRYKGLSANLHAGPAAAVSIDQMTAKVDTGYGVRYGTGVAMKLSVVTLFADAYRSDIAMGAQSTTAQSGVMVGVTLRK